MGKPNLVLDKNRKSRERTWAKIESTQEHDLHFATYICLAFYEAKKKFKFIFNHFEGQQIYPLQNQWFAICLHKFPSENSIPTWWKLASRYTVSDPKFQVKRRLSIFKDTRIGKLGMECGLSLYKTRNEPTWWNVCVVVIWWPLLYCKSPA